MSATDNDNNTRLTEALNLLSTTLINIQGTIFKMEKKIGVVPTGSETSRHGASDNKPEALLAAFNRHTRYLNGWAALMSMETTVKTEDTT